MKVLITTLASGWYKKLAPLFEYTAKKFNPDCDVKVFYKEDLFPSHPDSATAALRFCIPNEYFKGYDYVYITDVDFIFLPHKPSMIKYHIEAMKGQLYSAYRGRVCKKKKIVWDGGSTRIAGGHVFVSREWLDKTEQIRTARAAKLINGIDSRTKDEVILYRIMKDSAIDTPKKCKHFTDGTKFDKDYRNLHLGDFRDKFRRRWLKIKKMRAWFFSERSVTKYIKLCNDDRFRCLVSEARKEPKIEEMFHNLSWHLEHR